uniref:Putative secreted protein n=1 Tax=Amblyomma cajennense TaxID=34607 RepID=A0A023FEF4_AMBCJ
MVAGKSLPLVRVALSLVTRVDAGLVLPAAAVGLKADSAVCVLQSRVGGLAEAAAFVVCAEAGTAPVELELTVLLLSVRPEVAPRTMSESLLLAVARAGVVRAEEPSSVDTAPWPNDSSSRKPGSGGKAASSRSNFGASASSLDLLLSALLPSGLLEPFSLFFSAAFCYLGTSAKSLHPQIPSLCPPWGCPWSRESRASCPSLAWSRHWSQAGTPGCMLAEDRCQHCHAEERQAGR